ncbi:MAG: nuclear transport factor 2 (NTF2) superfamily protein [Paracoccaceae bacterium]|jgi:nuclear transport factor 2 (NTF2) superfamily protein
MQRAPLPPFDDTTARQKIRMAENAWNSRNPDTVTPAYTDNSIWRNRDRFITGHAEIHAFLTAKWQRENDYRLIKELWAHACNRIAVRFAYEWQNSAGDWFRSFGNENWEFAADGRMQRRLASINDLPIAALDRLFHWEPGPRPDDHPGLSDLGL